MKIANVKALVVTIRGKVDSGAEMPKRGHRVFTNRPINITNATLRPQIEKIPLQHCQLSYQGH